MFFLIKDKIELSKKSKSINLKVRQVSIAPDSYCDGLRKNRKGLYSIVLVFRPLLSFITFTVKKDL
jgi:hypothetical protein